MDSRFVYKADISDYFNSVDVDILLPDLKKALSEDSDLYVFLESLLRNPYVRYNGELIEERKGIMAGVPVSAFLANFYLRELDKYFFEKSIPYIRYSDDILVFAKDKSELDECVAAIKSCLVLKHLNINPDKETITNPGEKWTFLGFSYQSGTIDISDVSFEKLDWIFHSAACRAAVKAGDVTSDYELQQFAERVLSMPDIRYCPHGRPVLAGFTRRDIERLFGRV